MADADLIFYVDGVPQTAPDYDPGFEFTTSATIAAETTCPPASLGVIDELSIYNRALTADEIQAIFSAGGAGKCMP